MKVEARVLYIVIILILVIGMYIVDKRVSKLNFEKGIAVGELKNLESIIVNYMPAPNYPKVDSNVYNCKDKTEDEDC